jgi:hypothetical protein
LIYQGLFASSHYGGNFADGSDFKALFIDTRRNNETLIASNFTSRYGVQGEFQFGDGFEPPQRNTRARNLRGE